MGVIDHGERLFRTLSRIRQYARYSLGRVLGTVLATEGRYKFHIDAAERSHFMRVELNAILKILIDQGLVTEEQWTKTLADEAEHYEKERLRKEWPECTPHESGTSYMLDVPGCAQRARDERWPP